MQGGRPALAWSDDESCTVDGVTFVHSFKKTESPDRFSIRKRRELLEDYVALLVSRADGGNVVELGIAQGGSAALACLVSRPRRLVALELATTRVRALDELIERRDLGDVLRPHYGVDQGDRRRVADIVDAEVGDEPLDLVIDDASHLLEPTRATFEVLFPRLRPGGLLVIEDWQWQHKQRLGIDPAPIDDDVEMRALVAARIKEVLDGPPTEERAQLERRLAISAAGGVPESELEEPPLSRLAMELVLARASTTDVIAQVTVGPWWIIVERGPRPLDREGFRLADAVRDHFGLLS